MIVIIPTVFMYTQEGAPKPKEDTVIPFLASSCERIKHFFSPAISTTFPSQISLNY